MAGDDDAAAAAAKEAAAAAAKEAEDQARAEAARRAEEARLRAEALDAYEAAHEAIWATATAVVNVKAMIPIVLDKATGTYTKWRGMFLTVLGKYALTRHVLDDVALPDRPVWVQVDCVVLSWIFSTVRHSTILGLGTRPRDGVLSLGGPRHQVVPKEDCITGSRPSSVGTASPICICVDNELCGR